MLVCKHNLEKTQTAQKLQSQEIKLSQQSDDVAYITTQPQGKDQIKSDSNTLVLRIPNMIFNTS